MKTSLILAALLTIPVASSAKLSTDASSETQVAEAKTMSHVLIDELQVNDRFDFPSGFTFTKNSEGKYIVDFEENICSGELKDSGKQLSTVFMSHSPKWKLESKKKIGIKLYEVKLVESDKPQSKSSIVLTCNFNKNGISSSINIAEVLKSKGVKISRDQNAKFAELPETLGKTGKPIMDGMSPGDPRRPGTK